MTAKPTRFLERQAERFRVDPMYSSVIVRRGRDRDVASLDGHVYDISVCGARVEFDEPLFVGEDVALSIMLPLDTRGIGVSGRVVWTHDEQDDPGPRRLAVQFTQFADPRDRDHLHRYLEAKGASPAA